MKHANREAWLIALVDQLRPFIKHSGYEFPEVRISCGWPSSRALSKTKRRVGECWHYKAAEDKLTQIFISPVLALPHEVSECVVHELGHAALPEAGHKKPFKEFMRAVGLVGKATSTSAGPTLKANLEVICGELGPYPNSRLDKLQPNTKKQSTRMHKIQCADEHDPYILRGSKKTIDLGVPVCPICGTPMEVEEPEEADDE